MADATLYRQLAEGIGAGESPLIPKIFEALINDEEAKVLLTASPPATISELTQKTGLPEETIRKMIRLHYSAEG